MSLKSHLKRIAQSTVYSYSQIFFSRSLITGSLLLLASFFDVWAGLYGLISVLTANALAHFSGFSRLHTEKGLYGFNALLVGLGLGFYYQPSVELTVLILSAAILTVLITFVIEGIFYKYGLPFLSLPFIIALWLSFTASENFSALALSERNLFTYNTLYALGGKRFIQVYEYAVNIDCCPTLQTYLKSLGAIIFQPNILAGLLIALGLLMYSRIAFSLTLLGFFTARLFYLITGSNWSELAYNNIGFNYILTSVALGGFFILPSWRSYLWTVVLLPITVIITVASQTLMARMGLAVYALPFNLMVLTFLYAMKLRLFPSGLMINYTDRESPENSLYFSRTYGLRFAQKAFVDISLPLWGKWLITQAYNGKYTHKDEWRYALDFEMPGPDGKTFKGEGNRPEDYHAFGKHVAAPADGTVVELLDGIEDNPIGQVNSRQNWGNTVVIEHADGLYSQLSHLQKDSIKVKKGEPVSKGEIIARLGNSGYSPVPHLHFQMQTSPHIGAPTLKYPLSNFIREKDNKAELLDGVPNENDLVYRPPVNQLLKNAFNLSPGQPLRVETNSGNHYSWIIERDMYNRSFIRCKTSGAKVFFELSDEHFVFTSYTGKRNTPLFAFFLAAYHVKFIFSEALTYQDAVQVNYRFPTIAMFFHDFIAPFVMLVSANYRLECRSFSEVAANSPVELHSRQSKRVLKNEGKARSFNITAAADGNITVSEGDAAFTVKKEQRIFNQSIEKR